MDFFEELLSKEREFSIAPGVVSGIVLENNNKEFPNMVRVEYSVGEKGKNKSCWIPVSSWYAGNGYGSYFLPEIGTEVLIAFYMGNWDSPVVIGALWNKQNPMPPDSFQEKNTVKMLKTKGGHQILFQEEEKKETITITTPLGMKLFFDDENSKILFTDKDSTNSVTLDSKNGVIALDGEKKVELKVGGTAIVTIEKGKADITTDNIELKATQGVKITGQTVTIKGSTAEIKADGSLKINASGITEIKGGMVKIN